MLPGVSTACFYPQYTEIALRMLTEYSIQSVEIFINSLSELKTSYLKELRKIADDAGMRILSVHPYTCGMEPMYFFSAYDRRFDEGADMYKLYYEAANILGADIVVFHGAFKFQLANLNEYFSRFAKLHKAAKYSGVRLCQENVDRCMSYHPDFFAAMRTAIPDASFVLDTKQAVRAGHDILDYVNAMGEGIAHIHISDHAPGQDCMIPGTGVFNIEEFLIAVGKNRFSGGVIVELYQDNFDTIVDIYAGYQRLCTAFQHLGIVSNN